MVAEVIQMPDWRGDRERYRASRRNALLRAVRVPSEYLADFEKLRGQLERLASMPPNVGVSEQTAGLVRDWHRRVPGYAAVPMHLWRMIKQDHEWQTSERNSREEERRRGEARHRHLERIYGRSLSPFPPGS